MQKTCNHDNLLDILHWLYYLRSTVYFRNNQCFSFSETYVVISFYQIKQTIAMLHYYNLGRSEVFIFNDFKKKQVRREILADWEKFELILKTYSEE